MHTIIPTFAFMPSGPELVIILLVVLLLFGPKKLPELARGLGKSIKEFKKATSEIENEIKSAMDDQPAPTPEKKEVSQSETPPIKAE